MIEMLTGPIARILLRIIAWAMVGWGLADASHAESIAADADLLSLATTLVGIVLGGGVEIWYALAKRWGWKT